MGSMSERDILVAVRRQQQANRGRVMRDSGGMRKMLSIDPQLYHNAIAVGRQKYGVDNVFDHEEFVNDCKRWHPEICLDHEKRFINAPSDNGAPSVRNRFGRVKERYAIINGKLERVL
jgi:hypothetical protein